MAGVDYQQPDVAVRYARGRDLSAHVLERWRGAVARHLPDGAHVDVLDLGAGTGIFARAWPTWHPCHLVALEPAAAMRTQMLREGLPDPVRVVAGRGERLPLRAGCVDVVWLSAVIHHLSDVDRAAAEIRRVLTANGVVFVRWLFADLGTTPALDLLPGAKRAVSAFPGVDQIERTFRRQGMRLTSAGTVEDTGPATAGEAAERIRRLRSADTLLQQFTDDEIATGLAAMTAMDPSRPLPPAALGLLVLSAQD